MAERVTPRAKTIYPAIHENGITSETSICFTMTMDEAWIFLRKFLEVMSKPEIDEVRIRAVRKDMHIGIFGKKTESNQ